MTQIDDLKNRINQLELQRQLNNQADDTLEAAIRDRLPLGQTMQMMMPLVVQAMGATSFMIRTFNETLEMHNYYMGNKEESLFAQINDDLRDEFYFEKDGKTLIGQSLDVAGQWFGTAAAILDNNLDYEERQNKSELLNTWCEELDNYMATIAQARLKQSVTNHLADALTYRMLDEGVKKAISILNDNVIFDDMILVYWSQGESGRAAIHYKVVQEGELKFQSGAEPHQDFDDFLKNNFEEAMASGSHLLTEYFGMAHCFEEQLIYGVKRQEVIGRIVVNRKSCEFSTFDRDLLEIFSCHLRQRIVDFNREWRHLSLCFSPETVQRLMSEKDYIDRFLKPKEYPVVVMYTDISGFTKLSEQELNEPALIGDLIDVWSNQVVEYIWQTGGVFDKLVGDCVIGLWGPPFNEMNPKEACQKGLGTAKKIREFTISLSQGKDMPALKGLNTGVSTALNYCPMFVGLFGPNEAYTGFSSGMNNTARLQALAGDNEILCMEEFVEAHGGVADFGSQEQAQVKNVAKPIKYRKLL